MLDGMLSLKSVGVGVASENPHKIGGRPLMFLSEFGFRGEVYPVNPRHPPDLAVIAVPGASAIRAVTDATDLGIRAPSSCLLALPKVEAKQVTTVRRRSSTMSAAHLATSELRHVMRASN